MVLNLNTPPPYLPPVNVESEQVTFIFLILLYEIPNIVTALLVPIPLLMPNIFSLEGREYLECIEHTVFTLCKINLIRFK